MEELFKFKCSQRVHFDDLDAYKVVHNSKYFCFFERGRLEYLRNLGLVSEGNEGLKRVDVAVVENHCYYKKPALFDEILDIHLRISFMRNTSFQFQYLVKKNSDDTLVAYGYTNMVRVSFPEIKPIPLDGRFKDAVLEFEGENLGVKKGMPQIK
ncbi:acyl-CoA thioesterase [candidate division KSB1 bacterium]